MATPPDDESRRRATVAYARAEAGRRAKTHGIDFVDELTTDQTASHLQPPATHLQAGEALRSGHRLLEPGKTAFKAGFGFAAGEWLFQVLVRFGTLALFAVLFLAFVQSLVE